MAEHDQGAPGANEGEGSRTADREYREGVARTIREGHVEEDAERARKDVEADPESYRRAEEQGRSRSAGEAPGDVAAPSARDAGPLRSHRSLAEVFNRSPFSQAINSPAGRAFRLVAGSAFLAAGIAYRHRPLGIASLVWSFFPLSAGGLDLCWISAALGGPVSGARIRALKG